MIIRSNTMYRLFATMSWHDGYSVHARPDSVVVHTDPQEVSRRVWMLLQLFRDRFKAKPMKPHPRRETAGCS